MNIVCLVGRTVEDIVIKKTESGLSRASFVLAVKRAYKSATGEEQSDFIKCVAWRQTADYLGNYVKKGTLLSIEGTIQNREYMDGDKKRYITEVIVNNATTLQKSNASANVSEPKHSNIIEPIDVYAPPIEINSDDLPF